MRQHRPVPRRVLLWAGLALLLACRLLFAVRSAPSPSDVQARGGDEPYYVKIAQHLLEAREYKEGNLLAYRPPGFPTFLAGALELGRGQFWCLQVLQNLLLLGSALLLCTIILRTWGLRPALYSAILLLANPVWLMMPQQVLSETLFVSFTAGALFLTYRFVLTKQLAWGVFAGIVFGLSALTREIGLYFGIGLFLCVLLKTNTKRAYVLVSIACIFLTILPWTVRNYEKLHAFVLVDTNGPINLYMGNNPAATGTMKWALPPTVAKLWNQPGTEMEIYRQAKSEAIAYIESHPAETLKRFPFKLEILWGPIAIREMKLNADTAFRILRFMFWIVLFFLACCGFKLSLSNWAGLTVAVWAGITTALHLLTVVEPVYRAPMEFFLAVPAGLGLWRVEIMIRHLMVGKGNLPREVPGFASAEVTVSE